ncbi:MAG: archaemetzincin family Zn-dependent metalloprotease [Nitrospirota bacterium]
MEGILIIPIGNIDSEILRDIANALKKAFHCEVEINKGISIPQDALNTRRRQYHSTTILKKITPTPMNRCGGFNRVLGVIDADLYVPELNFVFGEADIYSGVTVISLTRLRQEFYGLHSDKGLFHLRAIKEAIHEIGHTYGLDHCQNPKCIMYFSNTLRDTDNKGPGFCNTCLSLLEDYLVV